MRRHTLTASTALQDDATNAPGKTTAITVTFDYHLSCGRLRGRRSVIVKVQISDVETKFSGRHSFQVQSQNSDTDIEVLIGQTSTASADGQHDSLTEG